jgi:diketogulonate reductase-like aldo/keto reductase
MLTRSLGNTGVQIPVIGQGTWTFGADPAREKQEIEALRLGIELGLSLIDTAESYASGGAETVVGKAIQDIRSDVFLVTKVSPEHCSYEGVLRAAEGSLSRLGTDYIDLYLQHWPSKTHPVEETMRAMAELVKQGAVKYVGVSNFTPELLQRAQDALGEIPIVCNQVGYHLRYRNIENNVLPYCQEQQVTVMAYSPFGGGGGFPAAGTAEREVLDAIGAKYGKNAYQVALNWILRRDGVVTIPKSSTEANIRSNAEALGWELSEADLRQIDEVFPRPAEGMPLREV